MPKNKFKECLDKTTGNTAELKKECSEFTSISIRRIQQLYSNPDTLISINNLSKLQVYFEQKWLRKVEFDELIENRNYELKKTVNKIFDKVINA